MANAEKCQEVLDYLLAHPEEHDQKSYGRRTSCSTTMCIAGTAAVLNGMQVRWVEGFNFSRFMAGPGGGRGEIFYFAKDILELTFDQADGLFYHATANDDALLLLEHYANGG